MPPWQAGFALGGNEPMHAVRWLASPRQGELSNARSALLGVAETGGSLFLVALLVIQKREKRKKFLVFFKRHLIRQPVADTFSHWRRLAKILAFVSALTLSTPAYPVSATPTAFASQIGQFPHFQRACGQCVHESARLFRALCSHAWYS